MPRPPQDPLAQVRDDILECLSATLKIPPDGIDTDIVFSDYGIDSILGVAFVDRINARLAISLNTAIIFEYPSVERLSRHVVKVYGPQIEARCVADEARPDTMNDDPPASAPGARPQALAADTPATRPGRAASATSEIAIIGMSGQFPKADKVEEFWRNLIEGVDGVQELPAHYLDPASGYSHRQAEGQDPLQMGRHPGRP